MKWVFAAFEKVSSQVNRLPNIWERSVSKQTLVVTWSDDMWVKWGYCVLKVWYRIATSCFWKGSRDVNYWMLNVRTMNMDVLFKVTFQKILGGKACFTSLPITFLKRGRGGEKIFLSVVGTCSYFTLRLSCITMPEGYKL